MSLYYLVHSVCLFFVQFNFSLFNILQRCMEFSLTLFFLPFYKFLSWSLHDKAIWMADKLASSRGNKSVNKTATMNGTALMKDPLLDLRFDCVTIGGVDVLRLCEKL